MNNTLLCGVGGQGTVLASRIIALSGMEAGFNVRTAETIGMSQRGGCVVSHVRVSDKNINSSLIPKGKADLIIAFEPAEAVRCIDYLKKDGTVLLTGSTVGGLDRVYQWWDMKAIYAGFNRTAGIHADGSIWVTNDPYQRTHLNTSAWNLHGERRSESKEPSPFETARKKVISILESVRDTGFKMTPALHASPLDEENIRRLEEIRKLSEESWAYRERIKTIKPLADIILSYNAAFLDFYKMFTFDQAHENISVSSDAYDTCIEFLTAVRILLTQVRGI